MRARDVLLLIPLQPVSASVSDPQFRMTAGGNYYVPMLRAIQDVQSEIGRPLAFGDPENGPRFGNTPFQAATHRSNSAVVLGTFLERAGLSWHVIDPGVKELSYWRARLLQEKDNPPAVVGLSTTFLMAADWTRTLIEMIREILPTSKLVIGGYYYATSPKDFLAFDADVLCIGEGELRFPEIVKRLRDGKSLTDIQGLYLKQPDGSLLFTGNVEAIPLSDLPPTDWKLSTRIEPPVDPEEVPIEFGLESQRGCVFKCEFCTYRTLAQMSVMGVDAAVDHIFNTAFTPKGYLNLIDATATYPHERYEHLLDKLIERGGAPHPMGHFARVSDITEPLAEKMTKANVKLVLIGQESGDQRILNLMKKGTRIDQVKPAIRALGKHGVGAFMSFIHGFPGETDESCENTRKLIVSLNEGFADAPPVIFYKVDPLGFFELSALSNKEEMEKVDHYLGYENGEFTAKKAALEVMKTLIEVSKVPGAPVSYHMLVLSGGPMTSSMYVMGHPDRYALMKWLKDVERLTAIFLAKNELGIEPDLAEIHALKHRILSCYAGSRRKLSFAAISRTRSYVVGRLLREWQGEATKGAGTLTRLATGALSLRDFKDVRLARKGFADAKLPRGQAPEQTVQIAQLAEKLRTDSLERAKNANKRLRLVDDEGRPIAAAAKKPRHIPAPRESGITLIEGVEAEETPKVAAS